MDRERAKQIILAIIREGGTAFVGRTRLFKTFYHAHLFHWRDELGILSDWRIVRMPKGPGIDQGAKLLQELAADGLIRLSKQPSGPFQEDVYELTSQSELQLSDADFRSIRKAIK
jgi:hypothetical protein